MIAPTSDPVAGDVSRGVKQVKDLLDVHGVGEKQFLVYHSASLLYPMLDRKLPTKYYCVGWAADPVMERELIGELERNRVRAFLHVNGIGAPCRWSTMCPTATAYPACTASSPGRKLKADASRPCSERWLSGTIPEHPTRN